MKLPFITRTELTLILTRERERTESEIKVKDMEIGDLKNIIRDLKDAVGHISSATSKFRF